MLKFVDSSRLLEYVKGKQTRVMKDGGRALPFSIYVKYHIVSTTTIYIHLIIFPSYIQQLIFFLNFLIAIKIHVYTPDTYISKYTV